MSRDAEINRIYKIINPDAKKSIWDPGSEFMRELEITKLRLETKPRKVNMMQAQEETVKHSVEADKVLKKLYVPVNGSYK